MGGTEFSLRCPLSGSRIRTPARFVGVPGLTAFDLEPFLGMVKRSKKWQCPHSMRNLPVQDLMIDGYLSRVLPRLQVPITASHPFMPYQITVLFSQGLQALTSMLAWPGAALQSGTERSGTPP